MTAKSKRNRKKSSARRLGDIAPRPVEWFWLCCNCDQGIYSEYIESCPNHTCYHTRCHECKWEDHEVMRWDGLAPSTSSGSKTAPRVNATKSKSYTTPPNLSSDQDGQSANISPLSMIAMKDDLVKHLKLSPETYRLMARETDAVYLELTGTNSNLEDQTRKPPYSWYDLNDESKNDAMRKLAASADSKSMVIWNIATPTHDCPNWIARWFLYHKFRYGDGRKWHLERDGTQLKEDIDGNNMEIQEKYETDKTADRNLGFYDPFRDPRPSTAQEDPHEVLSSMYQTRDQNIVKEQGHTTPPLTPQNHQPFRPVSPNSFQRALLQKRSELEGTETTPINETNTVKPSSTVEAEVHNLDSKRSLATFSDVVVRWRSTICFEDSIDKDSLDDDTEFRAENQVAALDDGKNVYTNEPQAPPDRDVDLQAGQALTKAQDALQSVWSQPYIGLAEAQASQSRLESEDNASLHTTTRPVSLSQIQYQDINPLELPKPGDYGSPIWKMTGTSNIGSQEPHSLKVKESVPVRGIFKDDLDIRSDISGNSSAFSVVTNEDSIFSLAVLSGSSMSSLHGSEDAANRLIELILEDKIIHVLCCKALSSINRERFERNLRRLLKGFATELRKEAKSKERKSASHFVALRATNSAHMICNKLNKTKNEKTNLISAAKDQDDETDDGSDDNQSESSEDGLDGIQQLEIFIKTSQAIHILRENLRSFVEQFDEQNRKCTNEKAEKVEHLAAPEEYRCLGLEGQSLDVLEAETNWVQQVMAFCDEAVRVVCQRPHLVGPRKTRIQWQCKCGHKIFDDFTEIQAGAADRYKRTFDCSNNSYASSRSSIFGSLTRTLSSGLRSARSILSFGGKRTEGCLPLHDQCSPTNVLGQEASSVQLPEGPPAELLFLLLCYSEGRYATKLLQLDLVTLQATSDKALFKLLRCNYASMRSRLISWFSLRTLSSIKFVQFELYRSLLVDVRKINDVPPPTEKNYRYRPAPLDIIPPVGEKHLLHLFENPECAEDDESCLSRFPKKLKEVLKCSGGVSPGWGLQFVEGWDTRKIWIIIFVFFGIGSLLIGVLWAVFEHSIQNAFSMAAYMVAFATVSVGTVQAILVM